MFVLTLIYGLFSPARGLTIESRQFSGAAKSVSDAASLGNSVGELSESAIVGIVVGVVALCLVRIGGYYGWLEKKKRLPIRWRLKKVYDRERSCTDQGFIGFSGQFFM
ncbi:hypothetical protein PM082_007151 [Marasmius tenuissimus]|nr:hypothetical protein PM082_007151 [Marasmius tenuissimus]